MHVLAGWLAATFRWNGWRYNSTNSIENRRFAKEWHVLNRYNGFIVAKKGHTHRTHTPCQKKIYEFVMQDRTVTAYRFYSNSASLECRKSILLKMPLSLLENPLLMVRSIIALENDNKKTIDKTMKLLIQFSIFKINLPERWWDGSLPTNRWSVRRESRRWISLFFQAAVFVSPSRVSIAFTHV